MGLIDYVGLGKDYTQNLLGQDEKMTHEVWYQTGRGPARCPPLTPLLFERPSRQGTSYI